MKKMFLTLKQAEKLAGDLAEYSALKDSSERHLFKGFEISFGDMLAESPQPNQCLEMTPLPEFTEISADS